MDQVRKTTGYYESAKLASVRLLFTAAIAVALALISGTAAAAPEEIQVYMDDLSKPGGFGVDVHNNFVMSGSGTPDYPGAQPPNHVYRLTPEFYYGISDTLEAGLYLLTTTTPGNPVNYDGEKLRLKYIAEHDETKGSFWGANLEIGKTSLRVSQAAWNAELKGIYGYRADRWTFAVNSNFDWSLSSPSSPVSLDIDTKVAYKTDAGYQIGLESYNELGPLRNLGHLNQLSQTLYGVIDTKLGKFDLNAGLGHGLTTASDRWLFKFIIGTHF
jgi:hypothetical protein